MTFALQTRFSLFFHDLCFAGELQTLACGLGLRKYRYRIVIHCFVTNPEYENLHLTERQISRIFYDDLYSRSTPTKSLYSLSLQLKFALLNSLKQINGKIITEHWQTSTKQTKTRPNKKTAESTENISAMKRNQNIYNDVPAISSRVVSRKSVRFSTQSSRE